MKKGIKNIVLCALFVLSSTGLTGCDDTELSEATYTWFISATTDSKYYLNYEDGPAMQYLMSKEWEDENGNPGKLNFEFQAPVTNSGSDTLARMWATDSYTDIIDTTFATDSLQQLYNDGIIIDITEYVENYMPNYKALLTKQGLWDAAYTQVGDERKILAIGGYSEVDWSSAWCGYQYRRDWIIKYGKQPASFYDPRVDSVARANPNAGQAFEGYYTKDLQGNDIHVSYENFDANTIDGDYFEDTVVFPSGNTDPIYISDWEWMFEIFDTAMEAEGITDGYNMSLFYPGYVANGELVSSFGGGNNNFYKNSDNEVVFGGDSDNFRTYLKCMNTWYEKGWIQKDFYTSSDMYYEIDKESVWQGKVGMWIGTSASLMTRINTGLDHNKNAMVYCAALPINDVYGTDANKLKEPDTFLGSKPFSGVGLAISNHADTENLVRVFRMWDYLYSEEGSLVLSVGLTKEQLDTCPEAKEFYEQYGIGDGAYTISGQDENGNNLYSKNPILEKDDDLQPAVCASRLCGYTPTDRIQKNLSDVLIKQRKNWVKYTDTGMVLGFYASQVPEDMSSAASTANTKIDNFMKEEIPKFIYGKKNYDIDNDANWNSYCEAVRKRHPETVIEAWQISVDTILGKK